MDAFQQHYWDLRQVLIWVLLGNRTLVQQCADAADWIVTDLTLDTAAGLRGGAAFDSRDEAERAVLQALQRGQIRAIGVRNGRGDPEEIPQLDCVNLKVYYGNEIYPPEIFPLDGVAPRGPDPPLGLGPPEPFRPGATYWHEVKFEREAVLSIWPDVLAGEEVEGTETAGVEAPAGETAPQDVKDGDTGDPIAVKIRTVLEFARNKQRQAESPLGTNEIVRQVIKAGGIGGKFEGYGVTSIRTIITGTNAAGKKRGFSGLSNWAISSNPTGQDSD